MEKTNNKIKVKNNSVAIVGWEDGGAGRIATWLENTHNYYISCFINPTDKKLNIDPKKIKRSASQFSYPTNNSFKGKPLINSSNWAVFLKEIGINKALVTTDDPLERFKEISYAKKNKIQLINAIHPTAYIMDDVILKRNIIIHEHSKIGYRSELYDGVIIDGAFLTHHNVIKECTEIVCGAVLGGNVKIGRFSRVFLGAIIINRIEIGENTIIGAGTMILKNIKDNVTVLQKPSKMILKRS